MPRVAVREQVAWDPSLSAEEQSLDFLAYCYGVLASINGGGWVNPANTIELEGRIPTLEDFSNTRLSLEQVQLLAAHAIERVIYAA
jgi:hypothetical protein